MERAVELFARDFERWDITLPARDVGARQPGRIEHDEWAIQYDFGRDAHGEFIDYYAAHRVPNYKGAAADRHVRLYDSGLRVQLPPILEAYVHRREPTREELERARQQFQAGESGPAEPLPEREPVGDDAESPPPAPRAPKPATSRGGRDGARPADGSAPRRARPNSAGEASRPLEVEIAPPNDEPRPRRSRNDAAPTIGRRERAARRAPFGASFGGFTPAMRWALLAAGVVALVGGGAMLASTLRHHHGAGSPDGVAGGAGPLGDSLRGGAMPADSTLVRRAPLPPRDLTGPGYPNATRPADLPSTVRPGSAMPLIPSGGQRRRSEPTVFRRKGVVR